MTAKRNIAMVDYLPARLVQARNRWYFVFYQTDPVTRQRVRHRQSFDIGRIPPADRLRYAQEIIDHINSRLPFGYPYDEVFYQRTVTMTARDAMAYVLEQSRDLRHASIKSYESSSRKFVRFLEHIRMADMPVTAITRRVALAYSDHMTAAGLSARSHNNDIAEMKRVFNVLRTREVVQDNPFATIPRRKVDQKRRIPIAPADAAIILDYLAEHDKSVYLSCCLLYFCFIRPNEQRQLQRFSIDLQESLIFIPAHISKNRKDGHVTIPDQLRQILIDLGIDNLRPHDYLLGSAGRIGNNHAVGKITMGTRYRDHIRKLHKDGALASIDGNTIYSWKDTGADYLSRTGISGVSLKEQFRHWSLDETQAYISQSRSADQFIRRNHRLRS